MPHGLHLLNPAFWGNLQSGATRRWLTGKHNPNDPPPQEQTLLQELRPKNDGKQAAAPLSKSSRQ